MTLFPVVSAKPEHNVFSEITFRAFSEFVESHFSSRISLAAVLVVLFTTTSNTDLLNLHARQQNPKSDESGQVISGWMKALARALQEKLNEDTDRLFKKSENKSSLSDMRIQHEIGIKLDGLSKLLKLYPYDAKGQQQNPLKPVSEKDIEPALMICPASMECQTATCNGQALIQNTRDRDVPRVTLVKGSRIYDNVHVLSGKCTCCNTKYYADHETSNSDGTQMRFYLSSAKYLKIGQSVWVD